ncbi:MAG TPA: hypothetical protein EYG80_05920 [Flavobacteriaceae bacterium]|nr:hypothetical protein [Flavobacteriaceae bacterium]
MKKTTIPYTLIVISSVLLIVNFYIFDFSNLTTSNYLSLSTIVLIIISQVFTLKSINKDK